MPELRKGELTDDQAKFCRANCPLFYEQPYPSCSVKIHIKGERKSAKNRQIIIGLYVSQIPDKGCPEKYK